MFRSGIGEGKKKNRKRHRRSNECTDAPISGLFFVFSIIFFFNKITKGSLTSFVPVDDPFKYVFCVSLFGSFTLLQVFYNFFLLLVYLVPITIVVIISSIVVGISFAVNFDVVSSSELSKINYIQIQKLDAEIIKIITDKNFLLCFLTVLMHCH